MASRTTLELQELREAAESYGARHVHLDHFAYPAGMRLVVNLTVDFDAMLLRRLSNKPVMQLANTVPAITADLYPAIVEAILENGHEVAALDFKHEDVSQLDEAQERERIEAATESLIAFGHRVRLLEAILTQVQRFPEMWNPTAAQCAQYWQAQYPASSTLHLEPSIWQDYPGSLS